MLGEFAFSCLQKIKIFLFPVHIYKLYSQHKLRMSGYSLFNQLFSSNIPHILEAIFFNLDSESFKKCKEVCKTWNELLSSAQYQKRLEIVMWQEAIESEDINKMRAHVRWQREQIRRLLKRKLSSMEENLEA